VTTVGAMFFTGQPKIMSYKIDEKQVAGSMPYQIAGKKIPLGIPNCSTHHNPCPLTKVVGILIW